MPFQVYIAVPVGLLICLSFYFSSASFTPEFINFGLQLSCISWPKSASSSIYQSAHFLLKLLDVYNKLVLLQLIIFIFSLYPQCLQQYVSIWNYQSFICLIFYFTAEIQRSKVIKIIVTTLTLHLFLGYCLSQSLPAVSLLPLTDLYISLFLIAIQPQLLIPNITTSFLYILTAYSSILSPLVLHHTW